MVGIPQSSIILKILKLPLSTYAVIFVVGIAKHLVCHCTNKDGVVGNTQANTTSSIGLTYITCDDSVSNKTKLFYVYPKNCLWK